MPSTIWETDPTVSDQYTKIAGASEDSPERRLLVALLVDALLEFQQMARSASPLQRDQLHHFAPWFFARDRAWPFSFENVCAHLDLNPDCIRSRLMRLASQPPLRARRMGRRIRGRRITPLRTAPHASMPRAGGDGHGRARAAF